jgi:hypothetical protein
MQNWPSLILNGTVFVEFYREEHPMKKIVSVILLAASSVYSQSYTTCPGGIPATLTANNPSNLSNPTYSLDPGGQTNSTGSFTVNPNSSTIYTLYTTGTNTNTAIVTTSNTATVTVISFPNMSLISSTGFTLGCNSKSISVISFSFFPSPSPPAIFSSSLLPFGSQSLSVLPGTLNTSNSLSITTAGTWTALLKMHPYECYSFVPFSVLSNTVPPVIDSIVPSVSVLSCNQPTMQLQGYSGTPNTNQFWTFIAGQTTTNTVSVSANLASATNTFVGTYTFHVIDLNNLCRLATVIPVYQNLFPPKAAITSGGVFSITCNQPTVVLSNQSSTGIPPGIFPTGQPVVGYLWQGPLPSPNASLASSYIAAVPGVYTLTAKDLNNGCMSFTTIVISENRTYPLLSEPTSPSNLCGGNATISASLLTSGTVTYSWTAPPTATVTGASAATLITNVTGIYTLNVKQLSSGCVTTVTYAVVHCVDIPQSKPGTELSVYPNPVGDILFIRGLNKDAETRVLIYNSIFQLVADEKIFEDGALNLKGEPGIYFITIRTGDEWKVVKVLKVKYK